MQVVIDSPVEPRKYEIQLDNQEDLPYCKVIFCNLSSKNVASIEYTLHCFNSFGEPVGEPPDNQVKEFLQDINVGSKHFFSSRKPTQLKNHKTTRVVEIIVDKVKFIDGYVWARGKYEPIKIKTERLTGAELADLKMHAGNDAICYAKITDSYWQCICGRVNAFESSKCMRCDRDQDKIINEASNQKTVNYEIEHNEKKRKELHERENEQNLPNGFKAAKEYLTRAKTDYQFRMRVQKCINEDEYLQLAKNEGYIFTIDELNEAKEWLKKFEDYF